MSDFRYEDHFERPVGSKLLSLSYRLWPGVSAARRADLGPSVVPIPLTDTEIIHRNTRSESWVNAVINRERALRKLAQRACSVDGAGVWGFGRQRPNNEAQPVDSPTHYYEYRALVETAEGSQERLLGCATQAAFAADEAVHHEFTDPERILAAGISLEDRLLVVTGTDPVTNEIRVERANPAAIAFYFDLGSVVLKS